MEPLVAVVRTDRGAVPAEAAATVSTMVATQDAIRWGSN